MIASAAQASELYTEQLTISNKTPYLRITIPPENKEMIAAGPSDATVVDNTLVILDSWGSALVYFNKQGNFLKRIPLPEHTRFERVVRDQDNSLFVLGAFENINSTQTMVVHVQNGIITEKTILPLSEYLIENIMPDDYGLFMQRTEEHLDRQKLAEACDDCLDKIMDEMIVYIEDRISRNCIACEPKPAEGIRVKGATYHINKVTQQSLSIGSQKVALLFYPQQKDNYSEIIQVDKNGTAWIKNSINFNAEDGVTYVWKINKFGKVISLYRFASDAEDYGTIWPVKHNIIISNDGLVYWMTSNKEQLKFRKLKAFSFQEMQALANKLDRKLIHKKKANTNIHEKMFSKLTLAGLKL